MKINNGAKAEFHAHLIPKRCSAQKEGKTGTMRIISPRGALQRGSGVKNGGAGLETDTLIKLPRVTL